LIPTPSLFFRRDPSRPLLPALELSYFSVAKLSSISMSGSE
jgi:hypothetical protein